MTISSGPVRFVLEGVFLVVVALVLSVLAPSWIVVVVVLAAALLLAVGSIATPRSASGGASRCFRGASAGREPEPAARRRGRRTPSRPERRARRSRTPEQRDRGRHEENAERPRPRGRRGRRARPSSRLCPSRDGRPACGRPNTWTSRGVERLGARRLAREGAGVDAARDEERALLLMHLREFAGPTGCLPASFDDLVRESFGESDRGERG